MIAIAIAVAIAVVATYRRRKYDAEAHRFINAMKFSKITDDMDSV